MTFYKILMPVILLFSTSTFAQVPLDWDQLNSSFITIVQEHVDTFDFLDSGFIAVDKSKSDLSTGSLSLGFQFKSSELNLVSSNIPQTLGLVGQIDLTTQDVAASKRVDFEASIGLEGDTLIILKHLNGLFATCDVVDPLDTFNLTLCKYVDGVESASSAKDLKVALEALREALLIVFPLTGGSNDEFHNIIADLNIVQQLNSVLVSALVNNLELFGLKITADVGLIFQDNSLRLQVIGSTILANQDYTKFVKELENILIGLQTKDPDTTDLVYNYTFLVFELLEGIFY